jgi:DNA-directed RNA polymerase specialized sigma54-like protein
MVLLQHKLSLKVSQRQILTPGLVQMVSVLALNKLELKDMITAEMVENPVLEELEESVPLIDDVNRKKGRGPRAYSDRRKPHHRCRRKERSIRRDRLRLILSGLSRSRLSQLT